MILSLLAQGGVSLNVVVLLASAAAAVRQHRTATTAARCGSGTQQAACAAALDDPPDTASSVKIQKKNRIPGMSFWARSASVCARLRACVPA